MFKNPKRITGCNCGGKIPRKFPKLQTHQQQVKEEIRSPDDENFSYSNHNQPMKINRANIIKQQRTSLGFLPQKR